MQARAGVIFDIDGTLLDNNYFHTLAWWRAFRGAGLDVPMAAIHHAIGMGGTELMARLIGEARPELSEAHGAEFERFRQEMRPLPGAADLLAEVRSLGLVVVLGTSAKPENIPAMLRALDAGEVIDRVVSSADVQRAKPHPDIFSTALEVAGLDASRTVVVGDTGWDVEAARRASLDCVGVTTGGWSRGELLEAGAVAVYEGPADLVHRISTSPIAALKEHGATVD